MNKITQIIGAAAALFVLTMSSAQAGQCAPGNADATDIFASASPTVVAIESQRSGSELFGSGFFWDNEGHIVTNIHVLGSDSTIVLSTGQRVKPEIVGYDANYDIAVLRVPVPSTMMGHGNSQRLRVGEPVYAIGNPYGVGISLSRGIVSGLNRTIETTERRHLFNLVQTDAALNPGNSGGPLIDQHGCLVGMNTAILSPSNTSSGVGFAMTVEQLSQVVPAILSGRSRNVASDTSAPATQPVAQPVGYGAPNYSR